MALDYHPPFLAIVKTQAWSLEERVTIFVAYQQGHFRVTSARSFSTLTIKPLFSIDVAEILAQITWLTIQ
jgi:hypothetical protein